MKLSPYKIVVIYLALAGLWIAFSDQILYWFIKDSENLTIAQSIKGFVYVITTGLLLYILISRYTYELRKAFRRERRREEEKNVVWRSSPDGIVGITKDGKIFSLNDQANKWLDVSLPTEQKFWDFFEKPYREQIKQSIEEILRVDKPEFVFSIYGMLRKERSHYWFEIRLNKGTYEFNEFVVATMHDITDKINREKEVELLKNGFEQIGVGIALAYKHGDIIFVNNKLSELLGKDKDQLKSYFDCLRFISDESETIINQVKETINAGKAWDKIFEVKQEDYSIEYLTVNVFPMSYKDEHFILVILENITQQVLSEKRLSQQQRMEALGYLANGVAHDFNNILGAILGHVDLILEEYSDVRGLSKELEIIRNAVLRGRDMTSQILSVSRENGGERIPLDISQIINEVLTLLKPKISARIKIEVDTTEPLPKVLASPGKINQILLNLCINACQAMTQGGILHIRTEKIIADEPLLAKHPELAPGEYLRILVSDTGIGIDPDIMEHIFEPFFTTKRGKGGSGVGLYIVRSLVTSLGGGISVYSDPGKGTRFCVYLPVYTEMKEEPVVTLISEEKVPKGSENILLVDDEPMLSRIIGRLLTKLGYQVRIVNNPIVAKEMIEQGLIENFQLAIIDNIMHEISGEEIIRILHDKEISIPVILTSGMITDEIVDSANKLGVSAILEKPCSYSVLGNLVRKVLDEYMRDIQRG